MRLFITFLLLGALFFSCENKSCTDVVCSGQNTTCVDGDCYCLPGYEGQFCDQLSYLKYVGSYQVSEGCTTTFGGYMTQQYSSSISGGLGNLDMLTINNFANRGLPIDATIVSANFLAISSQNAGSLQVSGGEGRFEVVYNRIKFDYNYTSGSNFHQCTAIFTRF